jgi:hypothetical protein
MVPLAARYTIMVDRSDSRWLRTPVRRFRLCSVGNAFSIPL